MKLWNVFIISTLQFIEVYGEVGFDCTGNDVTTCTSSTNTTDYTCINSICQCSDGFYQDSSNSCQQRHGYNESCVTSPEDSCNVINGSCYDVTNTCKCNNNFYTDNNNQCKPVSDLRPTDFNSTTSTTTNITFTWTISSSDQIKHFIITGTNLPFQPDISNTMTTTTITGLTPGTTYTNIIITAVVSTDRGDVNVSSNVISASTVPGKAGDLLTSNEYNTTKTMTIEFNAPDEGSVDHYIVNILNTNVNKTASTNSIQLGPNTLLPGILYTITITTFYKNKQGETSTQTFRTLAEGSSPVENLSITDIGSRKLTVSWSYPTDDKGNLTAYILDINDNGVCIQQYRFFYDKNNQVDLSSMRTCNNVSNISHDLRQRVNQDISNLLPDTTYTVSVIPYNRAGPGQMKQETANTCIEAADEVTEFNISDVTATSVTFTWKKPTPRPGPTNYTLLIYEQSNLSDENVSHLYHTETITDYNTEKYIAYNLTSFWYYRATIQAATESGSSSQVSLEKFQTQASAPGPVKNLIHEKIDNVFTSVRIKWNCPEERDRHGIIEGYNLSYTNEMPVNISPREDCSYSKDITVTPGNKYNYTVVAYSDEFVGMSRTGEYTAAIGKPIISQDSGTIIKEKEQAVGMTSFTLDICASCLLDGTNGEIIFSALIICVKDVCSTDNFNQVDVANLMSYKTWQQSKKAGFDSPYRITNDTWHQHLKGMWQKVVIGGESNCDNKPEDVVCNGPLNTDTEYRVIAISCTQGGCSATGPQGSFRTQKEDPGVVVPIVVTIVVLLVVTVAVIAGIVLYRRYKRNDKDDRTSLQSIDSTPKSDTPLHRPIKLDEFEDRLIQLKRDSNLLFSEEFEGIAELSPKHPSIAATLENNKIKNRYVNILPFDHSRVKLLPIDDEDDTTDYINANYIPGYKSQREYIATQGPLECTLNDFWRMIWEQRVAIIVMLSDLQEKGKPKVDKYWKEQNEPGQYGEIVVELTSVSVLNKYTIKIFEMKLGDEIRKVRHFFLPGWEDYRANLQPADVLEFLSVVRQEVKPIDKGPMVVHCSAGVGRTGTFIALDIFQQYINDRNLSSDIDIYDLVLRMRNFRQSMVQSEKQYIFIHETVKEIILQKKRKLMENDSVIYENTQGDHIYSNEAFVSDNDVYINFDSGKPTTVL